MFCIRNWFVFVSLCALLNPLNLEARNNLRSMNLLQNIETQTTKNELIFKLKFNHNLQKIEKPIFYKKSIQIDFPHAYSEPAKKFLTTGNPHISQIYVSQFDAEKLRIRFIYGKKSNQNFENRVQLQKRDNLLIIRVDLKAGDLLDQLLARAKKKNEENDQIQSIKQMSVDFKTKRANKKPIQDKVDEVEVADFKELRAILPKSKNTISVKKIPKWNDNDTTQSNLAKPVKASSFGFLGRGDKTTSNPNSLMSSGLKMIMTLSLILGLIFFLFFGFKKYVLKNTVFGSGEKLIHVVSTNYLAPKKNISLVEVAGEILVLGVSDQNISLLTCIREPDRIEQIKKFSGEDIVRDGLMKVKSKDISSKVSLATSNAKNRFSKYLDDFSNSESNKQASVSAVTEKIRRQIGKVRTT